MTHWLFGPLLLYSSLIFFFFFLLIYKASDPFSSFVSLGLYVINFVIHLLKRKQFTLTLHHHCSIHKFNMIRKQRSKSTCGEGDTHTCLWLVEPRKPSARVGLHCLSWRILVWWYLAVDDEEENWSIGLGAMILKIYQKRGGGCWKKDIVSIQWQSAPERWITENSIL